MTVPDQRLSTMSDNRPEMPSHLENHQKSSYKSHCTKFIEESFCHTSHDCTVIGNNGLLDPKIKHKWRISIIDIAVVPDAGGGGAVGSILLYVSEPTDKPLKNHVSDPLVVAVAGIHKNA